MDGTLLSVIGPVFASFFFKGLNCDLPGVSISTLPLKEGFWRASLESVYVRECFNEVNINISSTTVVHIQLGNHGTAYTRGFVAPLSPPSNEAG